MSPKSEKRLLSRCDGRCILSNVHSTLEEEYSPTVSTLSSGTPYYTRLTFTDTGLFGYARLNIIARNGYGSDTAMPEIPSISTDIMKNGADRSVKSIRAYSPSGVMCGGTDDIRQIKKFGKGMLILKIQYNDRSIRTVKHLSKQNTCLIMTSVRRIRGRLSFAS